MEFRVPAPVFILGSGRSGTTLLASLINQFSGVHIAKETGYISRSLALLDTIDAAGSLPALVELANSWLEVEGWTNRARRSEDTSSLLPLRGLRGQRPLCTMSGSLIACGHGTVSRHIGDNTPSYVWAIPKIDALLPLSKYIHMVRDPRDVAASMLKMRFGANDAVTAALDWTGNLGAWLACERLVPEHRRFEIRYEDLCADPERELKRVAVFLGISEAEVKPILDQRANGTASTAHEFASVAGKAHHRSLAGPGVPVTGGAPYTRHDC